MFLLTTGRSLLNRSREGSVENKPDGRVKKKKIGGENESLGWGEGQ